MQKSHTCTACGGKRQPGNKIYGSGYCICHPKKPNDIYVGNFLSVYRVRPENEGENSDDEDDKEDLVVSAGDLAQTCDTHVPVTEGDMKKGKWSLQRSLIVDAIESAKTYWKTRPCEPRALPNPCQGLDCNSVLKSVRRKTRPANCEGDSCVREPEVQQEIVNITAVKKNVDEWARGVAQDGCNAKQAVCRKVAGQVLQEISSESFAGLEPLRWAVHGGPGTGLQAVMAKDLNGDAIHHAFGLNLQGLGDERISGHKLLDLSAKALRLRWLIIDEISMVI